jgi:hypothetical protein
VAIIRHLKTGNGRRALEGISLASQSKPINSQ